MNYRLQQTAVSPVFKIGVLQGRMDLDKIVSIEIYFSISTVTAQRGKKLVRS